MALRNGIGACFASPRLEGSNADWKIVVSLATEAALVKPRCHEYTKRTSHMTTLKLRVLRGRIVTHFRRDFREIRKCCFYIWQAETMSAVNRSQEVSLSDSYVLILQETVKESKALRAQVAERTAREDEVNRKLEHLFSKVEKLCENANNRESSRKRKRSPSSSVNVPRQCRVRTYISIFLSPWRWSSMSEIDRSVV